MNRSKSLKLPLALTAVVLVAGLVPGEMLPGLPARLRAALRDDGLNRIDTERMELGYYEALLDAGRRFDDMGKADRPTRGSSGKVAVPLESGPLAHPVDDLREYALVPDLAIEYWGIRWTSNSLGMRDRPYAATRPPGTVRLAFIGDSIGAGWGVDDGQTFESLVETSLSSRLRQSRGGPEVEILNFAVPGHAPGQRWENFLRLGGWDLGIDAVLYEATPAETGWDERRLRGLLPRGLAWDSPLYEPTLERLGVPRHGDEDLYKRWLRPYRWEILEGVYRSIASQCAARGVPSVWVLVPRVGKDSSAGEREQLIALARRAGFTAIVDLSDVYAGRDPLSLSVSPTDYHPNAEGHALLARRLEAALAETPALQPLWSSSPDGGEERR